MKRFNGDSKKIERKTIEKNRRTHMKKLCFKLNSLVPSLFSQPYKLFTQESQFDHSIAYIEQLRQRIEALKDRRNGALRFVKNGGGKHQRFNAGDDQSEEVSFGGASAIPPLTVDVQELDGSLKVLLTGISRRNIPFSDIVSVVEEGGGEVVKGGYTTVGDKVVLTIHAKARVARIGIDVTSVHRRLQELTNRRVTNQTGELKQKTSLLQTREPI